MLLSCEERWKEAKEGSAMDWSTRDGVLCPSVASRISRIWRQWTSYRSRSRKHSGRRHKAR